jgi:hypothetical protein
MSGLGRSIKQRERRGWAKSGLARRVGGFFSSAMAQGFFSFEFTGYLTFMS